MPSPSRSSGVLSAATTTGVPTLTRSYSSMTSGSRRAMQPRVQSVAAPPPWMRIEPPRAVVWGGMVPLAWASRMRANTVWSMSPEASAACASARPG